jgi:hypothetical protein
MNRLERLNVPSLSSHCSIPNMFNSVMKVAHIQKIARTTCYFSKKFAAWYFFKEGGLMLFFKRQQLDDVFSGPWIVLCRNLCHLKTEEVC